MNLRVALMNFKPFLTVALSKTDKELDELYDEAIVECETYKSFMNIYAVVGKVPK